MPRKIPGVWGQSPEGACGRIRKLSDFRIGSLAFPLDGRSPASGRGGAAFLVRARLLGWSCREKFGEAQQPDLLREIYGSVTLCEAASRRPLALIGPQNGSLSGQPSGRTNFVRYRPGYSLRTPGSL